ncbi:eukaryotic translation initiation factor 4 gamma 1-like [Anguilla rostrata]|uniref:eukaryotic translation initiation factor 4 gamma 1-like n=1 Tax=Anguilla rostrata TaxID=7938 RepID=UPI0030D47B54
MSTPQQSRQVQAPKIKYDREFLLDLRFADVCMRRPEWLPHISDVVLDKPSRLSLIPWGASPLRGVNGGSDFSPPFINRGRQSMEGRGTVNHSGEASLYHHHPPPRILHRDSFQKARNPGNSQPPQMDNSWISQRPQREEMRKVIPGMPLGSDVLLNRAENAWRPAMWKLTVGDRGESDHEAAGTQEILCRIRSILNKLTPERFHSLARQVASLAINTAERLKGVVCLVFEKAISEPKFSVTYASMCRYLMELNVPAVDSSGDTLNFCSLLLDLCWKEFKKVVENDKIYGKRLAELDKVSTEEEKQHLREQLEVEAEAHRRWSLGNMRFIGELFKQKMVRENMVQNCIAKLLIKETEEALECLCCLLSTSGKTLDYNKSKPHMDQCFKQMEEIVKGKKTTPRIRFLLQDILELRQNNWVPRREDQGPKTIDQIHKEAEQEEQQEQIKIRQQLLPKRDSWGRGGLHPAWDHSSLLLDECWNPSPVSPKNHHFDASQLSRIAKIESLDINNLLFIPGGEGTWRNWSRGSNGGSGFKHSGDPESGCLGTMSWSTDCYRSITPRNVWNRDCGRYSDQIDWPENSGPHWDHFEHWEDGGLERQRLPIRKQNFYPETKEGSWETDYCSSASSMHQGRDWNRGRCDQDQVGNCNFPTWPVLACSASSEPGPAQFGPGQPNLAQPVPALPIPVQPSTARPIMTRDKLEKKSKAIINEYLHINDMKEALLCVQEIDCAPLLFVFVRNGIESVVDRDTVARERMGLLLHQLVKVGTLPAEQFFKGLQEILEVAEDMVIDVPHIWLYLAEIVAPVLCEGGLPIGQFFRQASMLPLNKAGVLSVEILLLLSKEMSHERVGEMWRDSGLSWKDLQSENKEAVIEKICCGCALTHCPLRT